MSVLISELEFTPERERQQARERENQREREDPALGPLEPRNRSAKGHKVPAPNSPLQNRRVLAFLLPIGNPTATLSQQAHHQPRLYLPSDLH